MLEPPVSIRRYSLPFGGSDNAFGADNQQERQQWTQGSREYQRKSVITWRVLRTVKGVLISLSGHVRIIPFPGKSPSASTYRRRIESYSLCSKDTWAVALFVAGQ